MFGSSGGFGFNVSFVDRAPIESVFKTSLSFTNGSGYIISCRLNFSFLQIMCEVMRRDAPVEKRCQLCMTVSNERTSSAILSTAK